MKVILLTAKNSSDSHSEYIALRAILTLVHRSVLSTNRIIIDMGLIASATRKRTETKRIPEINRNSDIEAIKLRELLKQNRIEKDRKGVKSGYVQ